MSLDNSPVLGSFNHKGLIRGSYTAEQVYDLAIRWAEEYDKDFDEDEESSFVEDSYESINSVEEENEIGETDFGSGYFILNVDKQELYQFLKANMPAGYVHDTFEEFAQNLSVNHFENDELNETGLAYKRDKNFVVETENLIYERKNFWVQYICRAFVLEYGLRASP